MTKSVKTNKETNGESSKTPKSKVDDDIRFLDEQIKLNQLSPSDQRFMDFETEMKVLLEKKNKFINYAIQDWVKISTQDDLRARADTLSLKGNEIISKMEQVLAKYPQDEFKEDNHKAKAYQKYYIEYKDLIIKAKMPILLCQKLNEPGKIFYYIREGSTDLICLDHLLGLCGDQYPSLRALIYLNKSIYYSNLKQDQEELESYEKILELRDSIQTSPFLQKEDKKNIFGAFIESQLESYDKAFFNLLIIYKVHGDEYQSQKNYHQSIACYESAIDLYKRLKFPILEDQEDKDLYKEISINLAIAYIMLNKFQKALDILDTIPDGHSDDTIIFFKANAFFELKEYLASLELCNELLISNPQDSKFLFLKASNLYQLAEYESATKFLSQAESNGYPKAECDHILSRVKRELGFYQEALELINQAIDSGFTRLPAYLCKAIILINLGLYDEGRALYEEVLAKHKKDSSYLDHILTESALYHNISQTYYLSSRYGQAIEMAKKSIESDDFRLDTYFIIAKSLQSLRLPEKTIELYEKLKILENGSKIDLSFLNDLDLQIAPDLDSSEKHAGGLTESKSLSEKTEDGIVEKESPLKIEIESLDDDRQFLAQNFNLHDRAEQLLLAFISLDRKIKERKISELNQLVKINPHIEKFILNLFTKLEEGKTKAENFIEIFAKDNPSLTHKFFQYKKKILQESMLQNLSFTSTISQELEGLHKINIANFKGNWFFKFTKQAIEFIGQFSGKIQDRINDLHIVQESAKGKLGFKLHDKLLKMVGLGEDDEIYASKTYQYHDQVKSETSMLSIFDSVANHQKIGTVIAQRSTQFVYIDDFKIFQELLGDQDIDSE